MVKDSDTGHYLIDVENGVLVISKLSEEMLVKFKKKASRGINILEDGSYSIAGNTLFIEGELKTTKRLANGTYEEYDYEVIGPEHKKRVLEAYHVGDEHLRTKMVRSGWFLLDRNEKTVISRGFYLVKKGIKHSYITSNFRIIKELYK